MDLLEDYWKGHPYLSFVTTLADVPGNFAQTCSHWGDQFYYASPFLVRDIGPDNDEGYIHDMFGFWWSQALVPPGLNLAYPLRSVIVPKVEDENGTLKLKSYVHQTSPGILSGSDPETIYGYQTVYYDSIGEWKVVVDDTYQNIFNQLIQECVNDPLIQQWNNTMAGTNDACVSNSPDSELQNICGEGGTNLCTDKTWCGPICESELINGCVDKYGPLGIEEYVENYAVWATADYSGNRFIRYDNLSPICDDGNNNEISCDISNCVYKIPGCIEPHASNCTSQECCSIGDTDFYQSCLNLDAYATVDDGSCTYETAPVYQQCVNPYSFNFNESLDLVDQSEVINLQGLSGCLDGTMNCCIFDCKPPHPFEVRNDGEFELQVRLDENPDLGLPNIWGGAQSFGRPTGPNRGGTSRLFGYSDDYSINRANRVIKINSTHNYQGIIDTKVDIMHDANRTSTTRDDASSCTPGNPCFIPVVFHDVYSLSAGSFTGQTRSLCPGNAAECECIAYRTIQKLNQQFKNVGIQFYRACTNSSLSDILEEETFTDNVYGAEWSTQYVDVGGTEYLVTGAVRTRYKGGAGGDNSIEILSVNDCNIYNTIPVLKENKFNAQEEGASPSIGYDHISLNGYEGDYPLDLSDYSEHTYFTYLYDDRNLANALNIYVTAAIGSNGKRLNDDKLAHTIHPVETDIPNLFDSSKLAIAIRQDALYSVNSDDSPYDYATLPREVGRFLGLFGVTDQLTQAGDVTIPADNQYGTVEDQGNMYCSNSPYNSCTPNDNGCGDLCPSVDCGD